MTRCFCLGLVFFLAGQVQAQSKKEPVYFTNSVRMKFVWIRPGTFLMGSPQAEKDRNALEVQHRVKLTKGFFMSVYPVTQEQWRDVVALSYDYVRPTEGFDIGHPARYEGKNLPMESISWDDCQVFLKKLRRMDKQRYRLPTEAEWEYACRAATTTPYYFGKTISPLQANFSAGAVPGIDKKITHRNRPTPAGIFPPNAWGLYDMHGNVAQWCQDRFGSYPNHDAVDPQGDESRGSRVLRGGSWNDGPALCRSASRSWHSPDYRGDSSVGFRVCFTPE